jgi:hypothetical protein
VKRQGAIELAADFRLPLEFATESTAIIGKRRSGKSHTAKRLVEQLHREGQQVVILDPKGDWWGLRSSADGQRPGLPLVIVGGQRGDVPIDAAAGETVARMVVEQRVSVLIDLSDLSNRQLHRFCADFLNLVYRLKNEDRYRTPLVLVVDESDVVAPQRPSEKGDQLRMLGAIDNCVRRGGQRGIGVVLVTQRPAVLNKDVLTQTQILVLLRLTGSQDIDAIDLWIKKHGQPDARAVVMAQIAALPQGTAWVWSPGWPDDEGIFRRVEVAPCWTFDSGATPRAGETRLAPATMADVDLEAFKKRMGEAIARAAAEDPRALRDQLQAARKALATAEAELARRKAAPAPAAAKRVEVPMIKPADLQRLERALGQAQLIIDKVAKQRQLDDEKLAVALAATSVAVNEVGSKIVRLTAEPPAQVVQAPESKNVRWISGVPDPRTGDLAAAVSRGTPYRADHQNDWQPPPANVPTDGDGRPLRDGARRMLEALARRHPAPTTRAQMAQLAKVAKRGGTFSTYLSDLRRHGLIDESNGYVSLTEAGWHQLGASPGSQSPHTTEEVLALYAGVLREGARRMIEALMAAYPGGMTRERLGEVAGVATRGGTFSTYLSDLRRAGMVDEKSDRNGALLVASETLMNPGGAA